MLLGFVFFSLTSRDRRISKSIKSAFLSWIVSFIGSAPAKVNKIPICWLASFPISPRPLIYFRIPWRVVKARRAGASMRAMDFIIRYLSLERDSSPKIFSKHFQKYTSRAAVSLGIYEYSVTPCVSLCTGASRTPYSPQSRQHRVWWSRILFS